MRVRSGKIIMTHTYPQFLDLEEEPARVEPGDEYSPQDWEDWENM